MIEKLSAFSNKNPLVYRMINGSIWSIIAAVLSQGTNLLVSILIARKLGKETFGEYGILNTTISTFITFAGLGLGTTATKYIAEFKDSNRSQVGKILGLSFTVIGVLGLFFSLASFFFANQIGLKILNNQMLASYLRIYSIFLFINVVDGFQIKVLQGYESFKTLAVNNLIKAICYIGTVIYFTDQWDLKGTLYSAIFSSLVGLILNYFFVRNENQKWGIRILFDDLLGQFKVIWNFSLPLFFGGLLLTPVTLIANIFITNQPNGYSELGIFNAANQWKAIIVFLPFAVSNMSLPIFSDLYGKKQIRQFNKLFIYNIFLVGGLGLLIAIPTILFSSIIMRFYGSDFETGKLSLILLSSTAVLISINNVIGQVIISKGAPWFGFLFNFLWALFFLVAAFLLRRAGALGLSLAYLISYICHTLIQSVFIMSFRKGE